MRGLWVALFCVGLVGSAGAESRSVVVQPVLSATETAAGQPIVLPKGEAEVIVSRLEIAPGAKLAVHKHPYPRYAYVLSGSLAVTDAAAGTRREYGPGDFIVEMVDRWHFGENIGQEPVELLVIDQVKAGENNTITR